MATIPSDQKFHTLNANTPTKDRGSSQTDGLREIYTMQDIIDTAGGGGGTAGIDLSLIVRDAPYTNNYDHEGTVFNFGLTGALAFGVYQYNGTTWGAASNSAPSSSNGLLGLGLGSDSFVLEKGIFSLTYAAPFSAGDVLYLGAGGSIINDISVLISGDVVRVIGVYLGQSGSVYKTYFNPSPDWIEIA
jgi:hypothetical protein